MKMISSVYTSGDNEDDQFCIYTSGDNKDDQFWPREQTISGTSQRDLRLLCLDHYAHLVSFSSDSVPFIAVKNEYVYRPRV